MTSFKAFGLAENGRWVGGDFYTLVPPVADVAVWGYLQQDSYSFRYSLKTNNRLSQLALYTIMTVRIPIW
jgi:hypothetical protein